MTVGHTGACVGGAADWMEAFALGHFGEMQHITSGLMSTRQAFTSFMFRISCQLRQVSLSEVQLLSPSLVKIKRKMLPRSNTQYTFPCSLICEAGGA